MSIVEAIREFLEFLQENADAFLESWLVFVPLLAGAFYLAYRLCGKRSKELYDSQIQNHKAHIDTLKQEIELGKREVKLTEKEAAQLRAAITGQPVVSRTETLGVISRSDEPLHVDYDEFESLEMPEGRRRFEVRQRAAASPRDRARELIEIEIARMERERLEARREAKGRELALDKKDYAEAAALEREIAEAELAARREADERLLRENQEGGHTVGSGILLPNLGDPFQDLMPKGGAESPWLDDTFNLSRNRSPRDAKAEQVLDARRLLAELAKTDGQLLMPLHPTDSQSWKFRIWDLPPEQFRRMAAARSLVQADLATVTKLKKGVYLLNAKVEPPTPT